MAGLTTLLGSIENRNEDLYAVQLGDKEIVFRLPSSKRAKQYQLLLSMSDLESERMIIYEHIFESYVQDKYLTVHDSDMPAGIPESIAKTIMFLSGADEKATMYTEQMFISYRDLMNENTNYMKRTICQVFPGYTFESLEDLSYQQIVSNFIHAEKVLLERGIIEVPFSLQASDKQEQKAKPYSVEDLIRQDAVAQKDFDTDETDGAGADRRRQMIKLREDARKRAKEQETAHMKKHSRF